MILFGWHNTRNEASRQLIHTKDGVGYVIESFDESSCYPLDSAGKPLLPDGGRVWGPFSVLRAKHMVEVNANQFHG